MQSPDEIKQAIKDKYGKIANSDARENASCCSCGCTETNADTLGYKMIDGEYTDIEGHVAEADLELGCGIPTKYVNIKEGDTVLDLGSGAGNDAFIARKLVGDSGKVIGLDMTPEMVKKATANAHKLKFHNVKFVEGEIENMPMKKDTIDVVLSNCVLNLVPSKEKAFSEIHRVLKSGGKFCVSDIVLNGNLPDGMESEIDLYVGCIAGAMQKNDYMAIIQNAGFKNVVIKTQKSVNLPLKSLFVYVKASELAYVDANPDLIESITVYGEKA